MIFLTHIIKLNLAIVLLFLIALAPSSAYGEIVFRGAESASTPPMTVSDAGSGVGGAGCGDFSVPIPAGMTNDILIALVSVRDQITTVTMPGPGPGLGWNELFSDTSSALGFSVYIFWRFATGSDPSTINLTGGCKSVAAQVSRFSGVNTTQPFENIPMPATNASGQDANAINTGTETTTINNAMLIVATFLSDKINVTEVVGWNESFDSIFPLGPNKDLSLSLNYRLQANAGSASESGWETAGSKKRKNFGVIFALRPAPFVLTINKPPGTFINDVMIASITVRSCSETSGGSCSLTVTPPAGWTLVNSFDQTTSANNESGFGNQLLVYLRVAGTTEPTDYSWEFSGPSGQTSAAGGILSFFGVDPVNPIIAQAGQVTPSGLTHTAPSIDTGLIFNSMLVSTHAVNSAGNWTPPTDMTEAVDIASLTAPNDLGITLGINYQTNLAAGSTGTRAATFFSPANADTGTTHLLALLPLSSLVPGIFNAFESSAAAGAVTGKIFTKLAGVGFSLDLVAITLSGTQQQLNIFNDTVSVDLVANITGSALDANNCPITFSLIQTLTPDPSIINGRSTVSFPALNSAYRDVRVRIRFPVSSPSATSCSTDNFSIRPSGLVVSSTNATQTGNTGLPAIKTGANFNLTAIAIAGYDGTPLIDTSKITGTPIAGTIGGNFGPAPEATGIATGNSFFYTEVGNFGLADLAVVDTSFTSADQTTDCIAADFSNTLVSGQYGCSFGSSAVTQITGSSGFGRFVPDNFGISVNTPQFITACAAGLFGYVGQPFNYTTVPIMTVTARSGVNNGLTNTTTRNYAGGYMKLSNANLTPTTQDARYLRNDFLGGNTTPILDTSVLPATAVDPAIGSFVDGVGTLTFSGGATGLTFVRGATPSIAFPADIALTINVIDADGVSFSGNPASFGAASTGGGIAFSNGKDMRFGRLRLQNAFGSELLPLPVPVTAEYWTGVGFVTNTKDQCTQISAANVGLDNFIGNLTAGETNITTGAAFNNGVGQLTLSAPGVANNGSTELLINLGASTTEAPCAVSLDPITTGANLSYLRGKWCPGAFDKDPAARITFGIYKAASEIIYMREQY